MNSCCHHTDLQHSTNASVNQKQVVSDRFLSTSYFVAMLVSLGCFPLLLKAARLTGESTVLFSAGCLGIATLVFTVVSFLYYSEADTRLKKRFAQMRNIALTLLPLLFWWAFYLNLSNANAITATSFEWAVTFGLCGSLVLLFMDVVLKLTQKQLLTSYLFLSAALCTYGGITVNVAAWQYYSGVLLLSGLFGMLGFTIQTQSEFSQKCQNVELLLLLSVMLQCSALPLLSF